MKAISRFIAEQIASVIWPSLTEPLVSRDEMINRLDQKGREAFWQVLIEEPWEN